MGVFHTPSNQMIYVSQYFQNLFDFGAGVKDDVRLSRYINNMLKLFGDDVVISGGMASSANISGSTFNVTLEAGKLIQDLTLIEFDSFSLDKSISGYTGDFADSVATKLTTALNATGVFTAVRSGNEVTITNNVAGASTNISDVNTGMTVSTVIEGVTPVAEVTQVSCLGPTGLEGTYFLLDTPTINYYVWYRVNTVGVDPAIAGRTGIMIDLLSTDINYDVATKTAAVINPLTTLNAVAATNIVTVTNANNGAVNDAVDGNTGFTILTITQGVSGVQEVSKVICTAAHYFGSSARLHISSPSTNYYIWFRFNGISSDPSISGRTGIRVDVLRGYTAVVFTEFQFTNAARNVTVDPCPFYFRLGLLEPVNKTWVGYTWNTSKNRLVMFAYDLDKQQPVESITTSSTTYTVLGQDGDYSYFSLLDGGIVDPD